jgi:hypothetical protein
MESGVQLWGDECSNFLAVNDIGSAQIEFTLFPNPSDDYIYLECNIHLQSITVFNAMGETVFATYDLLKQPFKLT